MLTVLALVCMTQFGTCEQTKVNIIDGDSISINGKQFRLIGIDAPEIFGKCEEESALAQEAKKHLMYLIDRRAIALVTHHDDKYGRTLTSVKVNRDKNKDGREDDVGSRMMEQGLARKWTKTWDGNKTPWCL